MMNKRPVAVICIFFIVGIVLAARFSELLNLTSAFTLTSICISACLFLSLISCGTGLNLGYSLDNRAQSLLAPVPLLHTFLFLSIISLGSLLYLNSNIFPPGHIGNFLGNERLKADITGIIKSPAEARGVYFGKISSRYLFEIETMSNLSDSVSRSGMATHGVNGLALVRIQTEKDYQYGDRLLVKGTIMRPGLPNDASRLRP
ncbi:MAG: hypothetical protein Q7O04_04850, partial [Candidatus Omnitrophota bacterium]|nr:hypothetical protein [Candidatus Omnitrophota bacterium]